MQCLNFFNNSGKIFWKIKAGWQLLLFFFFQTVNVILTLFRDLRGVVFGSKTHNSYQMLFDWLSNPIAGKNSDFSNWPPHFFFFLSENKGTSTDFFNLSFRLLEKFYTNTNVTNVILKFYLELVFNKGARISFDSNSVSGILLFKALAQILIVFIPKLLAIQVTTNIYAEK